MFIPDGPQSLHAVLILMPLSRDSFPKCVGYPTIR